MKSARTFAWVAMIAFSVAASAQSPQPRATANHTNDSQIRAVWEQWQKAFEAGDVNGIMAVYAPGEDLIAYDVVPPLQYKGKAAYRKDYEDFLAQFDGPVHVELRQLHTYSSGNVGFIFALERLAGRMKDGQPVDLWLRATSGLVKINGKWLIVHDHISVPADFATGKALLDLKP